MGQVLTSTEIAEREDAFLDSMHRFARRELFGYGCDACEQEARYHFARLLAGESGEGIGFWKIEAGVHPMRIT